MPSTSDKQRRAMHAAASGNSTIGIPKSVGKEYVQADHLREKHGYHTMPDGTKMKNSEMKGKYGNDMYNYGNHTKGGIHVTHWKPGRSYAGSMTGSGSIGGGSAGGGG